MDENVVEYHQIFGKLPYSKKNFTFYFQYDGGLNLAKEIRIRFNELGTMIIHNVVYRSYFVWIVAQGGKIFLESFINDNAGAMGDFVTSPIHVDAYIPKSTQGL